MKGLAYVVAALLDTLGLERVDVLGYSFGGGLAQELGYRAPERVRRLVLCATAPGLGGVPPKPMAPKKIKIDQVALLRR
jgi:pimeloyl-ACP methyl ester carboxylesterase